MPTKIEQNESFMCDFQRSIFQDRSVLQQRFFSLKHLSFDKWENFPFKSHTEPHSFVFEISFKFSATFECAVKPQFYKYFPNITIYIHFTHFNFFHAMKKKKELLLYVYSILKIIKLKARRTWKLDKRHILFMCRLYLLSVIQSFIRHGMK